MNPTPAAAAKAQPRRLATRQAEIRHRDRAGRQDAADPRYRARKTRHRSGESRAVWALQSESLARLHQATAGPAERQAHSGERDHADAGRRRQDHDHGRPHRRAQPHRQEGDAVHPRAVARPLLRDERRGSRRRLRPGRADGGDQSALHRRPACHRHGEQSARRADRQPRLLGERARHRHAPGRLAARHRHERPGAALARLLARRHGQWVSARRRLRHHRCLGGDGDLLPGARSRRSEEAARQYRRRLYPGAQAGARRRPQGAGTDDCAAQGRAGAEPRADARRHARLHPWRPVRQHRARLQLGAGDDDRAQARRLRGDRGGFRRRSRRREIHRHQMPQDRACAGLRGARRHHPRAQDAWRREEGRPQGGEPQGAGSGYGQSRAAHRELEKIRHRAGRLHQPLLRRYGGRDRVGTTMRAPSSASRR